MTPVVVVIGCTARKRSVGQQPITVSDIPIERLSIVADRWIELVKHAPQMAPARETYCGRNVSEAIAGSEAVDGDLYFVSAGLGLVQGTTAIPLYDLTLEPRSPNSIAHKIAGHRWHPADWWKRVSESELSVGSLASLFDRWANAAMLLALSRAYASLIQEDLSRLSSEALARVRTFGVRLDEVLPEKLADCVMPYDARLDGPDSPIQGTKADFAARAMRHFATDILANDPDGSRQNHHQAVRKALQFWSYPDRPTRTLKTDAELIDLIHRHWGKARGRSGEMLRYLRDNLYVACEQGRFRDLFHEAAQQRERGCRSAEATDG